MPRFVIERNIPGAKDLTSEQLRDIAVRSNAAIAALGERYEWIASYVAGDKFYCIHDADSADVVRAHASAGKFPADMVSEIAAVIGPETANGPAAPPA
jgi:hypothetical protein